MKKVNITNGVDLSVAETRWIGERSIGHQVYQPIGVFLEDRIAFERSSRTFSLRHSEGTKANYLRRLIVDSFEHSLYTFSDE